MTLEALEVGHQEIILPGELNSLPEVCQRQAREVIARAQNFERRQPWNSPRTSEEQTSIIPGVRDITQELFDGLRPFKETTWSEAFENGINKAVWETIRKTKRDAVVRAIMDSVKEIENRSIDNTEFSGPSGNLHPLEAWRDLSTAAYLSIVADQPGFEINPFLQMAKLYQLGLNRLFFHTVQDIQEEGGKERALLHFPLRKGPEVYVSCLAFGDQEPGDTQVLYYHGLREQCKQIKPLMSLRKIR